MTKSIRLCWIVAHLLSLASLVACSSAPLRKLAEAPVEPVSWIELGPDAAVIARLITGADECPRLRIDGGKGELPMAVRTPKSEAFQVLVCEATIPSGTRSAALGDQELPLPVADPHRILFIGDTGCRIQKRGEKTEAQWCSDAHAWPFPTLAQYEAGTEPDLIVHLGDYLYREDPCPPGNAYCANSPTGQNWGTWNADFFEPAKPLLRKAPWIFVRGNHELCARAGEGWFRFLDSRALQACSDTTEPFAVKRGKAEFVVLDSALAKDLESVDNQVKLYKSQFQTIAAMPLHHAWLITHKPLWAPALTDPANPRAGTVSFNLTMQTASRNKLPPGIDAVFSGHLHLFEEFSFVDGRPAQLVVGNGGTSITPSAFKDPVGIELGNTSIKTGTTLEDFGYFTLESQKSRWLGQAHDSEGRPKLFCDGIGPSMKCGTQAP